LLFLTAYNTHGSPPAESTKIVEAVNEDDDDEEGGSSNRGSAFGGEKFDYGGLIVGKKVNYDKVSVKLFSVNSSGL